MTYLTFPYLGIYNLLKFQVPIYFGLGEESDTKMSLTSTYLWYISLQSHSLYKGSLASS